MVLSNFCLGLATQMVWCTVFGMTTCVSHSVVLSDLIGIHRVTNAYGLIMLFQGIASMAGPPFVGNKSINSTILHLFMKIKQLIIHFDN